MTTANADTLIWVWIVVGGIFNTGIFINNTSLLQTLVPERKRAHHLAFLNVVPMLFGSLAGLVFTLAVPRLQGVAFAVAGFEIGGMKIIFGVLLVLNGLIVLVATGLSMPKGRAAARVFRGMYKQGGFRTIYNVMMLGTGLGEQQVIERTKRIGAMANPLAVDHLVRGLGDPSFRVRQESAWALGRIHDESGRRALEQVLADPDALIHEEAVWSLGQIGDERSLAVLLPLLARSDAALRGRVVLALGEIRSPRASPPLIALLGTERDGFVRDCIFDSLALLQEPAVLPELARTLAAEQSPRARRHLAMSLGLYLDHGGDGFYRLLTAEIDEPGSAGNALCGRLRGHFRDQGRAGPAARADALGDLYWNEAFDKVIDLAVELALAEGAMAPADTVPVVVLHTFRQARAAGILPGRAAAAVVLYAAWKHVEGNWT
ncbi:MAG: HEAT repeat domain-containing protein [Planctomycetota bacterium]